MASLTFELGDATLTDPTIPTLLIHGCNDCGRWGSGFAGSLSRRTVIPEMRYRQQMRKEPRLGLGDIVLVTLNPNWYVANCITQKDIITNKPNGYIPFRPEALRTCLKKLKGWLDKQPFVYKVQMPKVGAGLARGNWIEIQQIIQTELVNRGIDVTVYYQ